MVIRNKIRGKVTGVYAIISPINKVYVGSSVNIKRRFWYYQTLRCPQQIRLFNSLSKYGPDKHKFIILKECNREDLHKYEREYGLFFNVLGEKGLNCELPAVGENKPIYSLKTKEKKANHIRKIGEAQKGKKLSEEHKKNISLGNTGKIISKEAIDNWRKSRAGFRHSDETKKIISQKQKGRPAIHLRKPILMFNLDGIILGEYESILQASEKTEIKRKTISENLKYSTGIKIRITKSDIYGNVYFKYKEQ